MDELFLFLKIAGYVAVVSSAVVSTAIYIGKKLIDQHLAVKLEEVRTAHAVALHNLSHESGMVAVRVSRLLDRELEVFSTCWDKMNRAVGAAAELVSPLQQYSDLSRLTSDQARSVLEKSGFEEHDVATVLGSTDRNRPYQELVRLQRVQRSHVTQVDFHNYLALNEIFMAEDVHTMFFKVNMLIRQAQNEMQIAQEGAGSEMRLSAYKRMNEECNPLVDSIKNRLRILLRTVDPFATVPKNSV